MVAAVTTAPPSPSPPAVKRPGTFSSQTEPTQGPCCHGPTPGAGLAQHVEPGPALSRPFLLQRMGNVPFLAFLAPSWPRKAANHRGWPGQLQARPRVAQGAACEIPLLPGLPRALHIQPWPGRRQCAAVSALPNHIVNCFAAACES